jgi:hypothetical protein
MLYFPDIKFDDIGDMVCVFQYFQIVATRTSDTQCPVETSGCIHRLTMGAGAVIFTCSPPPPCSPCALVLHVLTIGISLVIIHRMPIISDY